jgi:hypothetical protein
MHGVGRGGSCSFVFHRLSLESDCMELGYVVEAIEDGTTTYQAWVR